MPRSRCIRGFLPTSVLLCAAAPSAAQWSADPAINTLASGDAGNCVVVHVVSGPEGSTWVAWYDSGAGYDIRLQRIDDAGVPVFVEPALIDDQSLSWVQDFDLAVDTTGRCAVAWIGESSVGAALVDLDGSVLWSQEFAAGSGAYLAQAQVCGASDGDVVVGWMQDEDSRFQRVAEDGELVWPAETVVSVAGTLIVSDIQPSTDGDVVASFVHYLSFQGAKRLKAQRIDASGSAVWGLAPVDVFTSGSLQYGGFPEFIPDGTGGGIFAWYVVSPLMARLQQIDGEGAVLWGTSGVAVTDETAMVHVNPTASFDPESGEVTVFWVRQDSLQSTAGVQMNRFDGDGQTLWGSSGLQVVPPASLTSILDLQARQLGDLVVAAWIYASSLGGDTVRSVATTAEGTMPWGLGTRAIGTGGGAKSDLSASGQAGQRVCCWADDRDGSARVYAQNIHVDGSLGPGTDCLADLSGDGLVGADDLLAVIAVWGPCLSCPEDFTGDDQVGTDDLLVVLAQWGPC
ncbi:MAG: hypothetical protein QF561_02230 [Phycisphaerales bacterium]|nr:hypothetical protein [Phycisphaerales bacterium]